MSSTVNYKLMTDIISGQVECIKRTDASGEAAFVPVDDANKDYREYLKWVTEGNTAEPAD